MTVFADMALQVRPLPGYCIASPDERPCLYVVPTTEGAPESAWLLLTPRMIADVAMVLMHGDAAPQPYDYGKSWIFNSAEPLGLRAVLTEE